jgi:S-adenosylmethionine:tRNA ribosyltransferase-isomerase
MEVPSYDLPATSIAQTPTEPRDAARLLVALDPGRVEHRRVHDLPDLLGPGDVLVVNTSRVLPARLHLTRRSGGAAEVLLLEPDPATDAEPAAGRDSTAGVGPAGAEPDAGGRWLALVRPGRRLPPGTELLAGDEVVVVVGERAEGGQRHIRVLAGAETLGEVPLPPYISQPLVDPERYQTVYADRPGSVAAPTAGLHLTTDVLDRCRARGVTVAEVDLAVGLGTFRPVKAARAEDHEMHAERYRIPPATLDACRSARRVVAVGTTTVRALETAAATGESEGRSRLFIHGDYPWRYVDVLLTNFHQPRSTLLLLLEAFCGASWRDLYATALGADYRFLSFGDAMIVAGGRSRQSPL